MVNMEEIKGKIDTFFTKKSIETESRYFICKALAEEYWESIRDDEPMEEEDEVDDFEDDVLEPAPIQPPIPVPKPPKNHKKGVASLIKKPKVPVK